MKLSRKGLRLDWGTEENEVNTIVDFKLLWENMSSVGRGLCHTNSIYKTGRTLRGTIGIIQPQPDVFTRHL